MPRNGLARNAAETIEDAEFLDENGTGAIEAATRLGFASPSALEKWLERHDAYDLWLSMKKRDPEGWHHQAKKGVVAVQTVDTIAALIEQGRAHSKKRLRNKAERIASLVDELRTAVAEDAQAEREREEARKEVERLERKLAEAKARLRGDSKPAASNGTPSAAIRAWAAENDMPCPARGRIPAAVVEAYELAREGAA